MVRGSRQERRVANRRCRARRREQEGTAHSEGNRRPRSCIGSFLDKIGSVILLLDVVVEGMVMEVAVLQALHDQVGALDLDADPVPPGVLAHVVSGPTSTKGVENEIA